RGEDQHGHRENRTDQSWNDIELGQRRWIVASVGTDLEWHLGAVGDVAVMRQCRLKYFTQSSKRGARGNGIGCVCNHQHGWLVATAYRTFEIRGDLNRKQHLAGSEQLVDLCLAVRQLGDLKILCIFQRSQD